MSVDGVPQSGGVLPPVDPTGETPPAGSDRGTAGSAPPPAGEQPATGETGRTGAPPAPPDGADGQQPVPPEGGEEGRAPVDTGPQPGPSASDTLERLFGRTPAPEAPPTPPSTQTGGAEGEGRQVSPEFEALLQRAQNGDTEAAQRLRQMTARPVQEAETLAQTMQARDRFKESAESARAHKEELAQKAASQRDILAAMEARLTKAAGGKIKNNPDGSIRQSLREQALQLGGARQKLDSATKAQDARHEDGRLADARKQLDVALKTNKGQPLAKAQIAALQKGFGNTAQIKIVNGKPLLVRPDGKPIAKQAGTATAQKGGNTSETTGTKQAVATGKTGTSEGPDRKEGEKPQETAVRQPTPADVSKAQQAVAQHVAPEVRKIRLDAEKERAKQIAAVRAGFAGARREFEGQKGEHALAGGARELAGARQKYRDVHERAWHKLGSGQRSSAFGLVYFDGKSGKATAGAAVDTARTAVRGRNTLASFDPGNREDVERGLGRIMKPSRGEFHNDLDPKSGIFGYFTAWVPRGQRGTYAGDVQADHIGHRRA